LNNKEIKPSQSVIQTVGKHIMKTLKITLYILIFVFLSCDKKNYSTTLSEKLTGKVFNLTTSAHNKILTIEFKDSTYTIYEEGIQNLEWFTPLLMKNIVVLDGKKILIQQLNDSVFKGSFVADSNKNIEILMTKRNPVWREELLNGIWMTESIFRDF